MAGGQSSRFGLDKAKVELGGKRMLTRMCNLVVEATGSVSVVAQSGRYRDFDVWIVEDRWPGEGPLGGIITALLATTLTDGGRDWNLIVSCDMPFLTREWLAYLLGRALTSEAHEVLPLSGNGPEPLCACWRREAGVQLQDAFDSGVRRVTEAMKRLRTESLDEQAWKRFDTDGRLFWNMNTREDYKEARRIIEGQGQ